MKTKKVFFDVKSGKIAAEGFDDCIVFSNQAKVVIENGAKVLYSPKGVEVFRGFRYCHVFETGLCHIIFADDKHYVYRLNGKCECIINGADDVIFYPGGWFTSRQCDVTNLYGPQGESVGHDIKRVSVTPKGKFAVTQDEDGYFILYTPKGIKYAYGFLYFLGTDEAFVLAYVDRILMIDTASFSETVLEEQSIAVLKHQKFIGVSLFGKVLYNSSGATLLSGCMDYKVYDNGLYRGIDYPGTLFCGRGHDCLYDDKGVVLNGVLDVEEYDNGCLAVLVEKGLHLYDSKGQHIAFLGKEEALGDCLEDSCFTLSENGKEVLYLANKTKVAEDVGKVKVLDCGLILTEKKGSSQEESVFNLYDSTGQHLYRVEHPLYIDETYGYYVFEDEELNELSVYKGDEEVLSGLSEVLFAGRLMFVKVGGDKVTFTAGRLVNVESDEEKVSSVYDMSIGLDEPIWSGSDEHYEVVFCEEEENFDRFWQRNP